MKISIGDVLLDVALNPSRKIDGRPNAALTYTASVRTSSAGDVRLSVGTDYTPPCLVVDLPAFDLDLANGVLVALGLDGTTAWTVGREGVYAFADGVEYAAPRADELAFMAAFGFVPGARFDLALPMLRAQAAQFGSVLAAIGSVASHALEETEPDGVTPAELEAAAVRHGGVEALEYLAEAAAAEVPGDVPTVASAEVRENARERARRRSVEKASAGRLAERTALVAATPDDGNPFRIQA